jgi:hypothetical protein
MLEGAAPVGSGAFDRGLEPVRVRLDQVAWCRLAIADFLLAA